MTTAPPQPHDTPAPPAGESASGPTAPAGRHGAQLGNVNGLRHGLRSRYALALGRMPPGASYVAKITNQFRRSLEAAVVDLKGEVVVYDSALINTAVRWERHALLAQKWLAEKTDLTVEQKISLSHAIADASSRRDKALAALDLHQQRRTADPMDMIRYNQSPLQTATEGPSDDGPDDA